jgi:hypothetical protein
MKIEQLVNRKLRIEGDKKSFNEFVGIWEKKHQVCRELILAVAECSLPCFVWLGEIGRVLQIDFRAER